MKLEKNITVEFTPAQLQVILECLNNGIHRHVFPVILLIEKHIIDQTKKDAIPSDKSVIDSKNEKGRNL